MSKFLDTDAGNGGVAQWLERSVVCGNVAGISFGDASRTSPVSLVLKEKIALFKSRRDFQMTEYPSG